MSSKRLLIFVSLGSVMLLFATSGMRAQVAPTLGQAQQFGVLGNSAVTGSAGAGTQVNGDVGSYPTATITNFPPSRTVAPFIVHNAADAVVQQAHADAKTAYDFLAAQGGTLLNDNLSTNGVIGPGVYRVGAGDLPAGTTLTLNGAGTFIFNVASTLVMNLNSVVNGTANPCNVYWRVGTSATLNGNAFIGTVIADASITVGTGNVTGRVLAGTGATGAVTMPSAGNTIGGCSAALAAPSIAKAFNPTSIGAGGLSRLTITLNNPNAALIALTTAFTDTLPSGVVIAPTPNVTTTCGGAVTAAAGGTTVTLASLSTIPAGSCTIGVDVTAPAAGVFINAIAANALQTTSGNNAAPASATLTATAACPAITLAPATAPVGRVGVAYSQQITASGGTGAYTFSVSSGTLPAGLTLSSTGLLSGTPTTAGSSTVVIRAVDGSGCPGVITYTIVIAVASCPVITLAPAVLPAGTVGSAYSQQITATGGNGTYVFAVLTGTLPTGLTLSSAGLLSGTPTAVASNVVGIQATDSAACPGVASYTVSAAAAPPPPPPPPLPPVCAATAPELFVTKTHSGAFVVGTPATYFLAVGNNGLTANAPITVTDTLPVGLTFVAASGVDWTCTVGGQVVTCTTKGATPTRITLTVMPSAAAAPSVINTATISGGGDCDLGNNSSSDATLVAAAVPTLPQWAFLSLAVLLTAGGVVALRRRRTM